MRMLKEAVLAVCALMLCAVVAPATRADNWNKKTTVTFTEDVEIPGQVLPAGTYVFRLADLTDRHFVQIWNADENQLIATVMANPAIRMEPATRSIFELEERSGSSPMALKYWFFPGDTLGQEFSYSTAYNKYGR